MGCEKQYVMNIVKSMSRDDFDLFKLRVDWVEQYENYERIESTFSESQFRNVQGK